MPATARMHRLPLRSPDASPAPRWRSTGSSRSRSRITRAIANLALQRFYVDRIFSPSGPITGGAVIYEQLQSNDLYPNRDIRRVEAGDEFPVVTFERGVPLTAQVEKFGGKFPITDEAVRRNQPGRVDTRDHTAGERDQPQDPAACAVGADGGDHGRQPHRRGHELVGLRRPDRRRTGR